MQVEGLFLFHAKDAEDAEKSVMFRDFLQCYVFLLMCSGALFCVLRVLCVRFPATALAAPLEDDLVPCRPLGVLSWPGGNDLPALTSE